MNKAEGFRELLERGVDAHRDGRTVDAIGLYGDALRIQPDDGEANSLLGLALVHANRLTDAEAALRRAIRLEPGEAGFRLNLVECLERRQSFDDAAREIDTVLTAQPHNARAWEKKGDLATRRGDADTATRAYAEALIHQPDTVSVGLKLSRTLIVKRRLAEAAALLHKLSAARPADPAVLDLRGELMVAQRDWTGLEALATRWSNAQPHEARAWQRLAQAAFEQGRHRRAMQAYSNLIDSEEPSAEHLVTYATICLHALELDAAQQALDRAEAIKPELPGLLEARGLLLTYLGDFERAEDYCRRSLKQDPHNISVYAQLSRLTHGKLSDSELQTLTRYADDRSNHSERRVTARYAIAHALDQRQKIDEAFEQYAQANDLQRQLAQQQGLDYDAARSVARTDTLIELFPNTTTASPSDMSAPGPIFIVGMPRSGTTLVESLFAAHSMVSAGGERPHLPQILHAYLAACEAGRVPGSDRLSQWADAYRSDIPAAATGKHLTDKNPLNFESAGLIACLYPTAPIVHIRRRPLETCLSVFRHEFTKFWTFAHRLEDIGHYYAQYARLVEHWQRTLGERFVTIDYEQLASDFEHQAPELLRRCGLEWENACLDFARTVPAIATFSAVQAREPVSLRQGKADTYRHRLEPLVRALHDAGVDPETGRLRRG